MSIQEILKLPESDRLQMVEQIWDSLETKNIEVTPAQKDELDRRIALDEAGQMEWHSMEEVKRKLSKKV